MNPCDQTLDSSVKSQSKCTAYETFWRKSKAVARRSSKRSHPEDGEEKNSRCESISSNISFPRIKSTTRRTEEEKSAVQKELLPGEGSMRKLDRSKNGRLSSGASGKTGALECTKQSVVAGSHGNVYLGSPHRRISTDQKTGVNGFPLSSLTSDPDKEAFLRGSNRWKQIGRKISPMTGKCPIPQPFFIRAEKESNEREALDSRHDPQFLESERRNSVISTGRLSRISNESGTWMNPDSSFARNQRTRRTKELLRQKSQEQIFSKQRQLQQRVLQIEELANRRENIDTGSFDDPVSSRNTTTEAQWTTALEPLQCDDRSRNSVSDQDLDSLTSNPMSPYLRFEGERIRVKY